MTAIVSRELRAEIFAKVGDASTKTERQLDAIAADYALTLAELRQLLAAPVPTRPQTITQKQIQRAPRKVVPPATPAPAKVCTKCKKAQPLTEFHAHPDTRDGKSSQCRKCNSQRKPTVSRIVRTRARGRAMYLLVERHRPEFERLLEDETRKAIDEHQRLQAEAEKRGQADAEVARLKTGPKRREQTSAIERLDVARCPSCHQYHDAGHPACVEPLTQKDVS